MPAVSAAELLTMLDAGDVEGVRALLDRAKRR
jgi:hypothetical protein